MDDSRRELLQFEVLLALCDGKPAGFCAWRWTLRFGGVAEASLQELIRADNGGKFLEVAEPNTAVFTGDSEKAKTRLNALPNGQQG